MIQARKVIGHVYRVCIGVDSLHVFSVRFWNCSDSVVYCVFHFISSHILLEYISFDV